jgi:hypothetical protein
MTGLTCCTPQTSKRFPTLALPPRLLQEALSLKVEYVHIGLNQIEFDNTQMVGGPGFFSTDNLVRPNIDIVRAGVNVKLDSLPAFLPSFLPMN